MKRLLAALLLAVIVARYIQTHPRNQPITPVPPTTPTAKPTPTPAYPRLTLDGNRYAVFFYRTTPRQDITLVPNFDRKKPSGTVKDEHLCTALINGGFYTEDGTPLGYFVADGTAIGTAISSGTFNGFAAKTDQGYVISRTVPPTGTTWAVQSGPIIFEAGEPVPLRMREDEADRRSVFALDTDGQPVFLMLTLDGQSTSGPTLEQLPRLISEMNRTLDIGIADAVNLDGGTASAYHSPDAELSELTDVGSFLCAR